MKKDKTLNSVGAPFFQKMLDIKKALSTHYAKNGTNEGAKKIIEDARTLSIQ